VGSVAGNDLELSGTPSWWQVCAGDKIYCLGPGRHVRLDAFREPARLVGGALDSLFAVQAELEVAILEGSIGDGLHDGVSGPKSVCW
jgi:hypothetical protein